MRIFRKPAMSLVLEAIEDFSGVALWTSNQHVDARECRLKRDYKKFKILQEMQVLKNPFIEASSFVASLGTGITSDETIVIWLIKLVKI